MWVCKGDENDQKKILQHHVVEMCKTDLSWGPVSWVFLTLGDGSVFVVVKSFSFPSREVGDLVSKKKKNVKIYPIYLFSVVDKL